MIALRAAIRARADVRALPTLVRHLRRHPHLVVDTAQFLALVPGAGSTIVTSEAGVLTLDVVVDRRELIPVVVATLEHELRSAGAGDVFAIAWTRPDHVPAPLR